MKNKKGLTIAELLTVIVFLGVIFGIVVPNYLKNNQNNEPLNFVQELKNLNNILNIIAETRNDNYMHYPHPSWIDYNQIDSEYTIKEGFPYQLTVDTSSIDHYLEITLNANSESYISNYTSGVKNQTVVLPYSLSNILKANFGKGSILKAYPIDIDLLNRYSPSKFTLSYPKTKINGYGQNLFQNQTVLSVPLNEIIPSPVSEGSGTDNEDRIPNDGIEEKPGYFLLVDSGDTKTVIYTGTDVIYKNTYIHMPNFLDIALVNNKGNLYNFSEPQSTWIGDWTLSDNAEYYNSYVKLTNALNYQRGSLIYNKRINQNDFEIEFLHWSGGRTSTTGADYVCFIWGANTIPVTSKAYSSCVDEHLNPGYDQTEHNINLNKVNSGVTTELKEVATPFSVEDSTWRKIKIKVKKQENDANVTIYIDGELFISYKITNYTVNSNTDKVGFFSYTWASNNEHRVDNIKIYSY